MAFPGEKGARSALSQPVLRPLVLMKCNKRVNRMANEYTFSENRDRPKIISNTGQEPVSGQGAFVRCQEAEGTKTVYRRHTIAYRLPRPSGVLRKPHPRKTVDTKYLPLK